LECVDYLVSRDTFEIYACASCGFMFTQDVPDESEMGAYYHSPDYVSHTNTRKGLQNRLYHKVRRRMLRKKARIIEKDLGLAKGSLLDIGTGTGYFPNEMKSRGWEVAAVERDEGARRFAKEHFGLEVGTMEEFLAMPAQEYDVVTLWHVLEHLQDLPRMWDLFARSLSPSGFLLIAVPNCRSYDAKHYGSHWAAYDVPRHLWHFTPQTVALMAEKYGFKIVRKYAMPFDAFYISMLSEKNMQKRFAFVRGLWTGCKACLRSLGKADKSSSIIYVLKKESL